MRFIDYLNQELSSRKETNKLYSMRAFAKSLRINPGVLSQLLSGKRKFTPAQIQTIGLKLGLSPQDIKNFVTSETEKNYKFVSEVNTKQYHIFSEWYYSAILQFPFLDGVDRSFKAISKSLGLKLKQVRLAMKTLKDEDFISYEAEDSNWELKNKKLLSIAPRDNTPDAIRRNLIQQHEQSLYALKTLDTSERIHSGLTLSFAKDDLEKAKLMIKNFNREFMSEMSKSKSKNSVYQINVFFYPLSGKQDEE